MFAIPVAACRRWFEADFTVASLPGGLSNATAWMVGHGGRQFVLKSFAAAASREHAEWVHAFMRAVRATGVLAVPAVQETLDGDSLHVDAAGTLWEMVEWKPGRATRRPSSAQAAAAANALARVHCAGAARSACPPRLDHSPGVLHRVARARALQARPWAARLAAARGPLHDRFARAEEIIAAAPGRQAIARVAAWKSQPVALQPVLRDVWSDHLLFVGSELMGMIDWHAAGSDTPATDLARLLGTWSGDARLVKTFLDAYCAIRPVAGHELTLVPFLRDTGILFGLDNWFRWIVEENRQFADMRKVEERIDDLLAALPAAVQRVASGFSAGFGKRGEGID